MKGIGYLVMATFLAAAQGAGADETVRCKDGTTSPPGRDACAQHGGVDTSAAPAPVAPAPPPSPPAPPPRTHMSRDSLATRPAPPAVDTP